MAHRPAVFSRFEKFRERCEESPGRRGTPDPAKDFEVDSTGERIGLVTRAFAGMVISVIFSEHVRNPSAGLPETRRIVQLSHFTASLELLTLVELRLAD